MPLQRTFTVSKYIRAAALLATTRALLVIVNANDAYQNEETSNVENKTPERRTYLKGSSHEEGKPPPETSARILFLKDLWGTVTTFVKNTFLEWVAPHFIKEKQGPHTCYRNICFNYESGLGLEVGGPVTPEIENTTFIFFDNLNSSGTEVNETTWEDFFYKNFTGDISKPLVAIVHGLNGTRRSPWAVTLRKALFENVNCNVLVVDWQHRAALPHYAKAASSSPLVGVLLSFMLQKIIEISNCSLHPDNVHIIGFSLGAHAAGVCGRHFFNTTDFLIGRITGLDPAGPLFEESNVSLTSSDAAFVDVIHTNAGKYSKGRFGLNKSIGHVDFWPNGGYDQPNCDFGTDASDPGCSHKRAQALFTESVYRNCTFKSYYCEGGWNDFLNGNCSKETNQSYIGTMGLYSINASGRGNQYLNTSGTPPYCINTTKLTV